MSDIKKLDDEEFVKVTGADSSRGKYHVFKYYPGDRKNDPCKHCGAVDSLAFDRIRTKTINGETYVCNIFKCEKCGDESYFNMIDDRFLI